MRIGTYIGMRCARLLLGVQEVSRSEASQPADSEASQPADSEASQPADRGAREREVRQRCDRAPRLFPAMDGESAPDDFKYNSRVSRARSANQNKRKEKARMIAPRC